MKVLLVDDRRVNREIDRLLLEYLFDEVEIVEAQNGREATELVLKDDFDIILMDIRMPPPNGVETARRLTALPNCPPIVLLSAYSDAKSRQLAKEAGASLFFEKPVSHSVLALQMRRLVNEHKDASDEHKKRMIAEASRRLQRLQEQRARQGFDTPVHIVTEIEDLEEQLRSWKANEEVD